MTANEFVNKLEEDVFFVAKDSLTPETLLSELEEWDSMATIAVIAVADEYLGLRLVGEQISACKTVSDLIGLVKLEQ